MSYYVEHLYASGWADAEWTEDGKPLRFATPEEARAAIDEHIKDSEEAFLAGDLIEPCRRSEYRVSAKRRRPR
jgi:hypothetical protein